MENKNKILAYVLFKDSEAFEAWQIENPDTPIGQVTPLPDGMEFDLQELTESETKAQVKTTAVKVFVMYWKNILRD